MAAAEAIRQTKTYLNLPPDSVRVGDVIARSDSSSAALAYEAAQRLAPVVERAYGAFAERLLRHPFVVISPGDPRARDVVTRSASSSSPRDRLPVLTSSADSTGRLTLRSSVYPTADALYTAWAAKAQQVVMDELGPPVRDWLGGPIALTQPTRDDWSSARVALLLAASKADRECADGDVQRCLQVLGLSDSLNPVFDFYDASERSSLIRTFRQILRTADVHLYDRCTQQGLQPACDSVAELIPGDALSLPAPPLVRQSFVRFALQLGGSGAFDRFAANGSRRERIEAAAKMPIDSVVARWRATIADTKSTSTAIDLMTAVSSLVWAGACAGLALRSSRWR